MGAEVAVVSFAHGPALQHYAGDLHLPFPLLSDPERGAYEAYGLGQGSRWSVFGPKTAWEYVKLMARGRRCRGIQVRPLQLGGDFVIDGKGVVRFAHRGDDPADRPSIERLPQAVQEAAP